MTDEESYTISQISEHNEIDDAWVVLDGIVYDISDFLEDESNHPGGITLILEWLGKDISDVFKNGTHEHSESALEQLGFYRIGKLI